MQNVVPKVVLDTNILVSSVFWSGASYRIVKLAVKRKIQAYTSNIMLKELRRVLKSRIKYGLPEAKIQEIIGMIRMCSMLIYPRKRINAIKEDSKDNRFLECALEANADYLISGDKHLLNLKEFRGIKIVTPREFLMLIEK